MHDEVDPLLNVMKVEKAPLESYADIGGLETQIQEIKEAVELPLTHPEIYEDMGIKPPKGRRGVLIRRGHFVRRAGDGKDFAGQGRRERDFGDLFEGRGVWADLKVPGGRPEAG